MTVLSRVPYTVLGRVFRFSAAVGSSRFCCRRSLFLCSLGRWNPSSSPAAEEAEAPTTDGSPGIPAGVCKGPPLDCAAEDTVVVADDCRATLRSPRSSGTDKDDETSDANICGRDRDDGCGCDDEGDKSGTVDIDVAWRRGGH